MTDQLPGEPIDGEVAAASPDGTYRLLLGRGVLAFQACAGCEAAVFPPRGRCPHCGSADLSWRRSSGRGEVYSATVLTPRDTSAYCVVLIDLEEGHRMMSRMVGVPEASGVSIGDRVVVRFENEGDEMLPLFAPAEVPA